MKRMILALVLGLGGCTARMPVDSSRITEATSTAIGTLEDQIPSLYLLKCSYMEEYKSSTAEEIYDTTKRNNEKARQCRIRHNGLVEILKERAE